MSKRVVKSEKKSWMALWQLQCVPRRITQALDATDCQRDHRGALWMETRIHIHMHACVCLCACACVHVHVDVCLHTHTRIHSWTQPTLTHAGHKYAHTHNFVDLSLQYSGVSLTLFLFSLFYPVQLSPSLPFLSCSPLFPACSPPPVSHFPASSFLWLALPAASWSSSEWGGLTRPATDR